MNQYLGITIILAWVAFVVYVLIKRSNQSNQLLETLPSNLVASPLLKEQLITLESSNYGLKVEFLKHDLTIEEMVQAGEQVFELKSFLDKIKKGKDHIINTDETRLDMETISPKIEPELKETPKNTVITYNDHLTLDNQNIENLL